MKRKKLCMADKSEIILLFYLKNLSISFCLIKFYELTCQKHFEDQLKSYKYAVHFQYCLKSHQLTETDMYLWSDLFYSLIDNYTAVHFFENNPGFDCELFFLSPLLLRATEKWVYKS